MKLKQLSRMLLQRFYCWLWKRTFLLGNASKANFTSSEEVHHIIHNNSTKPPFPRFFVKPSTALEIHPSFSGVYNKGVGEMGEKGTERERDIIFLILYFKQFETNTTIDFLLLLGIVLYGIKGINSNKLFQISHDCALETVHHRLNVW